MSESVRNEGLNGKKLHGAAGGDLEPRESTIFCTFSAWSTPPFTIFKCDIILILMRWRFD